MIQVPEQFRPHIRVDYPPNNDLIFEEWFDKHYNQFIEFNRCYLPVYWTSYYVNHNYGNDKIALAELQSFINNLDKSKRYFTIVQYDDGILNDLSKIDCKVFGMGGGHYDYPLPLIAKPHPYTFTSERDVFCNFMGGLTHQIRKDILPHARKWGYLCSTSSLPIQDYCLNLSRSVFTLCPRGYGLTSFRMWEAMQYGSIPVYISDKFMLPFNLDFDYGVIIHPSEIWAIDNILKALTSEEIAYKRKRMADVLPMFTYEGCKQMILQNI